MSNMNVNVRRTQPNVNSPVDAIFDQLFAFHFASEYRDFGWPVIPLLGKTPAIPSWKEFQRRRPTLGELAAWFGSSRPRFTNLGIVTGNVSGLVVVDCDSSDATNHWIQDFQRTPLVVQTGGGGSHHYYQMPTGVELRNRTRINGWKIDIRAEGGYVVCPPSRHPNGRLYAWSNWSDYSINDIPVLDPSWLDQESPRIPNSQNPRNGRRGVLNNVREYLKRIHATSGAGGHNATFRAARILAESGYEANEALETLSAWNETNAHPPWSVKELVHKVNSAFEAEQSVES